MKVRIKISRDIKKYFDQYGSLSYCVNRLLRSMDDVWVGYPIKACLEDDKSICWTTVDINSSVYDALREMYGTRSTVISVSRLLSYAYSVDFCHNWTKDLSVSKALEAASKLSKDKLLELINILKERYDEQKN